MIQAHVTYISHISPITNQSDRLSATFLHLPSILDLYPKFSDPTFNTDLIIIDTDGFYDHANVCVFDIVNSLSTLIKSTTCTISEVIAPRTTILAATADLNTNVSKLKDVLCSDIKGIYPRGSEFSIEEKEESLVRLLSGQYYVPQKIQMMLKPKKVHNINITGEIHLTPRQTQVLSLIRNRGASNKAIARILHITESTVKLHVTSVLKKFGVRNRTQLALFTQ